MRFPSLCRLVLFSAGLALVVEAREYPLFKPMDPQHAIHRFGPISDQLEEGGSSSKITLVESDRSYPHARVDVQVEENPKQHHPYAGIRFDLEAVRLPDKDSKLIIRIRSSRKNLPIRVELTDIGGTTARADLTKVDGLDTRWKYLEIPLAAFDSGGKPLKPFLDSISIVVTEPGESWMDIALVALNAP